MISPRSSLRSRRRSALGAAALLSAVATAATAGDAHAGTRYPSVIGVGSHTQVHGYCSFHGCYREEVYDLTIDEMTTSPGGGGVVKQSIPVEDQSSTVGTGVVRVADLDGDGLSDLVFWTPASIDVSWGQVDPTGQALFSAPTNVLTGSFYGSTASLVGDVDGDGLQDLVAWSPSSIAVMYGKANRGGFSGALTISTASFAGGAANLLEDLNLDGKADFIAWSNGNVSVEVSEGYWTQPPKSWLSGSAVAVGNVANLAFPYGPQRGKDYEWPSLWAIGNNELLSVPVNAQFDAFYYGFGNVLASNQPPFWGNVATFALDVNLDQVEDLVEVDTSSVYVALGDYTDQFQLTRQWSPYSASGALGVYGGYTMR